MRSLPSKFISKHLVNALDTVRQGGAGVVLLQCTPKRPGLFLEYSLKDRRVTATVEMGDLGSVEVHLDQDLQGAWSEPVVGLQEDPGLTPYDVNRYIALIRRAQRVGATLYSLLSKPKLSLAG